MRRLATAAAIVAMASSGTAEARALHLRKVGDSPAYRAVDETVSAADGRRSLYVRTSAVAFRAIDTDTGRSLLVDLRAAAGVGAGQDCRPAAALPSVLLVSCDASGAVLLGVPGFERLGLPSPTPPAAYLAQVLPTQWQDMGAQWLVGGTHSCADPRPRCVPFYLNWHTGAYHLANGFDTGYRAFFHGTRRLSDPALRPVPGCERRYVGQCDQMRRYALRLTPGRLDLLRSGRVVGTLSRRADVAALDLSAGRAAWATSSTLHLRGVLKAGSTTYALPTPPAPGYRPVKISQTDSRVLLEMASAVPGRAIVLYAGTIPKRLRVAPYNPIRARSPLLHRIR